MNAADEAGRIEHGSIGEQMRRRKRTEVTVEVRRQVAIRGRQFRLVADCLSCGKAVEMATLDEAALLAGVSSRAIWSWVVAGDLHCRETAEGLLRICLVSLDLKRQASGPGCMPQ